MIRPSEQQSDPTDKRLELAACFCDLLRHFDPDEHKKLTVAVQGSSGQAYHVTIEVYDTLDDADHAARNTDRRDDELRLLRYAICDVVDLMAESHGITGYHQNGDVATWEELIDDREDLAEAIRRCRTPDQPNDTDPRA